MNHGQEPVFFKVSIIVAFWAPRKTAGLRAVKTFWTALRYFRCSLLLLA